MNMNMIVTKLTSAAGPRGGGAPSNLPIGTSSTARAGAALALAPSVTGAEPSGSGTHPAAALPARRDPAEGASEVVLRLEAALDVDGDLKVWRRDVRLRLLPTEPSRTRSGFFWSEAIQRGCGGELRLQQRSGGRVVRGLLHRCPDLPLPASTAWPPPGGAVPRSPDALGTTTSMMRRGAVGWLLGASSGGGGVWSDADGAVFALALDDATTLRDGAVVRPFAEVANPRAWAEALDELHAGNYAGADLDVPIQFVLA